MAPSRSDVQSMVLALFTLTASLERARHAKKGASTLSLLQVVAGRDGIRPSAIADLQQVHPSLVTRQIQELEDLGYVQVSTDPADRRSYLVTLTPAGADEVSRLQQVGLDRFAEFVADWDPAEVRTLTALLEKLGKSKAAVAARQRRAASPGRRVRPTPRRARIRSAEIA